MESIVRRVDMALNTLQDNQDLERSLNMRIDEILMEIGIAQLPYRISIRIEANIYPYKNFA